MKTFIIAPRAESDIEQIHEHIAQRRPRAAARFLDKLESRFEILARFPAFGDPCADYGPGSRCSSVGNYVVIHRPTARGVEIVRVLDGRRNLPSVLQRS